MRLELTLEFQESDLTTLKVLEIGFRPRMTLIFFTEHNRKISTLIIFKVNENKCSGIQKIKFSKFLQNV